MVFRSILACVLAINLAGCTHWSRFDDWPVGGIAQVIRGEVLSVTPIMLSGGSSGFGTLAGAAVGAEASRNSSGFVQFLATIFGAIFGTLAETSANSFPGQIYTIRTELGTIVEVTQPERRAIPVGEFVLVQIDYRNQMRVIYDHAQSRRRDGWQDAPIIYDDPYDDELLDDEWYDDP